jgi:membrane associated rhomboid family serine protease
MEGMQATTFLIGPYKTPKSIKWLISTIAFFSIISPIATYFLANFFGISGPNAWFPLSRIGLFQGWFWQPATYFFLHSVSTGISLSFLISLFFHLLLLWFTGSEFAFRFGSGIFFLFYFGAGIFAGLFTTLFLFLTESSAILVGSSPPTNALIAIWAMLYPELELSFFFMIRMKAKWLVGVYFILTLLISLSYGAFFAFFADLCGIIWGFLLGRFIWKLKNPFPLNLEFPKRKKKDHANKIIDISVFHEDDDVFMDRMLEKINKEGHDSLTKRERKRMQEISNRKKFK